MCVVIEAIWHLYGTSVKKHDVVYELEPSVKYSQVEFVVYLDRKPLYFVVNIIVPCCLLIAISLLVRLSHSRPLYYSAPNRPPPHTHPHRRLDFGAYGCSTLTPSAENFWPRHWSWRAEYCDERVCVCVCVSVHDPISRTTRRIFTTFLCVLFMAVARSSSDGVRIRYVLLVLRMTSYLHMS